MNKFSNVIKTKLDIYHDSRSINIVIGTQGLFFYEIENIYQVFYVTIYILTFEADFFCIIAA